MRQTNILVFSFALGGAVVCDAISKRKHELGHDVSSKRPRTSSDLAVEHTQLERNSMQTTRDRDSLIEELVFSLHMVEHLNKSELKKVYKTLYRNEAEELSVLRQGMLNFIWTYKELKTYFPNGLDKPTLIEALVSHQQKLEFYFTRADFVCLHERIYGPQHNVERPREWERMDRDVCIAIIVASAEPIRDPICIERTYEVLYGNKANYVSALRQGILDFIWTYNKVKKDLENAWHKHALTEALVYHSNKLQLYLTQADFTWLHTRIYGTQGELETQIEWKEREINEILKRQHNNNVKWKKALATIVVLAQDNHTADDIVNMLWKSCPSDKLTLSDMQVDNSMRKTLLRLNVDRTIIHTAEKVLKMVATLLYYEHVDARSVLTKGLNWDLFDAMFSNTRHIAWGQTLVEIVTLAQGCASAKDIIKKRKQFKTGTMWQFHGRIGFALHLLGFDDKIVKVVQKVVRTIGRNR